MTHFTEYATILRLFRWQHHEKQYAGKRSEYLGANNSFYTTSWSLESHYHNDAAVEFCRLESHVIVVIT